jgi:hypothetical protein
MGRTACTEPQCLYSRAIPLLPLWAVWPVQNLSACTKVHFTLTFLLSCGKSVSYLALAGNNGFAFDRFFWLVMTQIFVQYFKISCSSHRHCGNYLHRVHSSEHLKTVGKISVFTEDPSSTILSLIGKLTGWFLVCSNFLTSAHLSNIREMFL